VLEALGALVSPFVERSTINKVFSLPLSFGGIFVVEGLSTLMLVSVPAAAFVSLAVGIWINRPVVVQNPMRPTRLL
jgi:hypothetical protein